MRNRKGREGKGREGLRGCMEHATDNAQGNDNKGNRNTHGHAKFIDNLSKEERTKLLERIQRSPVKLTPFKKDKIESIMADFEATNLYEDQFLKDLEEGLKKSSAYGRDTVPIEVTR